MSTPDPDDLAPPPWHQALPRLGLRLAVLVVIVYLAHGLISAAMTWTETLPEVDQTSARLWVLVAIFALYAMLIAVPFVPGIEIAIALLMLRGADLVWPIYSATVAGLILAYLCGHLVPLGALRRVLLDLHLTRACALLDKMAPLSAEGRIALLQDRLKRSFLRPILRYRYVCLAVLINLPGSALLGGGGGISMMAGMSGLFSARWTIPTLALAVLPAPLLIWLSGSQGLSGWLAG